MLLYNTEWQYDHGMAVNYCGKKFYNIGPWSFQVSPMFVSKPDLLTEGTLPSSMTSRYLTSHLAML
jgi:hypothetical protein